MLKVMVVENEQMTIKSITDYGYKALPIKTL
jgi:hypothetical protein